MRKIHIFLFLKSRLTVFILYCLISITAAMAQTVWRPFSDDSPWNTPVGDLPLIDKNSSVYLGQTTTLYRQRTLRNTECPLSATRQSWGIALFFIDGLYPYPKELLISCHSSWGKPLAVPLPKWAEPDRSEDAHLCLIDRDKGLEWDFWNVKGKYPRLSCGSSALVNTRESGVIRAAHGCRESGFPLSAGLVRPEELRSGEIRHALVFGFDGRNGYDQFVYPAITGCDDKFGPNGHHVLPMGSRLQLSPDYDLSTLTPAARIVARALQTYGMYLGDEGDGHSMGVYFQTLGEINNDGAVDDWTKLWQGLWDEKDRASLAALNAGHFRVLELPAIGAGRPPLIAFTALPDTITTDKEIRFKIEKRAGDQPIARVQFFLDQTSYTQPSYTDKSAPFSWRVGKQRLSPGLHSIRAVATDQKGSRNRTSRKFYVAR